MMTVSEIRRKFLDYFEARGHQIVASSPLVPRDDKTLLFTNAGMVQFKNLFLGLEKRHYTRATTSQRCVRAGGKHNDLENVGYTARHHTFFEMLGNFSFGEYFKREAIEFAWEFLTVELDMPEDRLWVTVFEEDDEAFILWEQHIGVPRERIARIGAEDNFWQMGETGPCGPCSEIFYDHGPDTQGGPPGTVDEDGDRYIEIWNLVFMQYDRAADGSLVPLPEPSVDTGMGLERIAAVLQGVHSNYDTDLFQALIRAAAASLSVTDLENKSLRVIADHIRSCAFLIVDGVTPSNEGRGYVLRRIIRRAARHGHKLGANSTFFHRLVAPLVEQMGGAYPQLCASQANIEQTLLAEEDRFNATLEMGIKILEETVAELQDDLIPGDVLFKLYDTYGFPVDLTTDIARERKLRVDIDGFEREMDKQRARARALQQFSSDDIERIAIDTPSEFIGYQCLHGHGEIVALYVDGRPVEMLEDGQRGVVVLDKTPFYGESGGQVGDIGVLCGMDTEFIVEDTQRRGDIVLHMGHQAHGSLHLGNTIEARVDTSRRQATVLNHSATHLLHAVLRKVLGEKIEQKGSLVAPNYLRFDFSHRQPVDRETLDALERWVNGIVRENHIVRAREMSMEEARLTGAIALFDEKYGRQVRVINMGDVSVELCGGTHVARTGDIGLFRILSETGIAAGVRRIEAVTGDAALAMVSDDSHQLSQLAGTLKTSRDRLEQKARQIVERNRLLERNIGQLQQELAVQSNQRLIENAVDIDGIKVLAAQLEETLDGKILRQMADNLADKIANTAIVLAVINGSKVTLVARVAATLTGQINAGDMISAVAVQIGGRGGGRADRAQAGGNQPENLPAALASVPSWVQQRVQAHRRVAAII